MFMKNWLASQRKVILLGVVAVGLVLVVAVMNRDATEFHLSHASNILRRWSCPPGGFPTGAGQRGNCVCGKCPKGYRCPGGFSPKVACRHGRYQNVLGQNACKLAPRGTFVNRRGAQRPTPCGYGTYNNKQGQSRCTRASPGYYVPATGRRYQTPCPKRQYQNRPGQRACKPSRPGTFVNKRGQKQPTPCPHGTYQDQTAQISCKRASPGYFVPARGQARQRPCRPNTFQHCSGQTRCIPCEPGLVAGPASRKCSLPACSGNKAGVTYVSNKIVGCSGAFTGGVFGQQAKGLCNQAGGWEICSNVAQVRSFGLTAAICASKSPANTFFGTQQRSSGNALCDNRGANDVFGCGNGNLYATPNQGSCTPFNKFVGSWTNPASGWDCRTCNGHLEANLFKKGAGNGGVLCCKVR